MRENQKAATIVIPQRQLGYRNISSGRVQHFQDEASKHKGIARSLSVVHRAELLPKPKKSGKTKTIFVKRGNPRQVADHAASEEETRLSTTAQTEAAVCDFSRLMLGPERAPKARIMCDEDRQCHIVQRAIPGYIAFEIFLKSVGRLTEITQEQVASLPEATVDLIVEHLIRGKIFEAVATNYIEEDNDSHWNNIGFNEKFLVSIIDKDQALATKSLKDMFGYSVVSARDIASLLNTEDFQPNHAFLLFNRKSTTRPIVSMLNTPLGQKLIAAEKNDPRCLIQKYKILLKAALLSESMIRQVFAAYITDEPLVKQLTRQMYYRTQKIKQVLLASAEFKQAFISHSDAICAEIETELDDYNHEFRNKFPEKQILVEVNDIKSEYLDHFSNAEVNQLIQDLRSLERQYQTKVLIEDDDNAPKKIEVSTSQTDQLSQHELNLLATAQNIIAAIRSKPNMTKLMQVLDHTLQSLHSYHQDVDAVKQACIAQLQTQTNITSLDNEQKKVATLYQNFYRLKNEAQQKYHALPDKAKLDPLIAWQTQSLVAKIDAYLANKKGKLSRIITTLRGFFSSAYKNKEEEKVRLALLLKQQLTEFAPLTQASLDKKIKAYTDVDAKLGGDLQKIVAEVKAEVKRHTSPRR